MLNLDSKNVTDYDLVVSLSDMVESAENEVLAYNPVETPTITLLSRVERLALVANHLPKQNGPIA